MSDTKSYVRHPLCIRTLRATKLEFVKPWIGGELRLLYALAALKGEAGSLQNLLNTSKVVFTCC